MDTTGMKQVYYAKRCKQTENRRTALRQDLFHVLKEHASMGVTYGDVVAELSYAMASFAVVGDQICMYWDCQPSVVPGSIGYRLLDLTDRYSIRQPLAMPRPMPDGTIEDWSEVKTVSLQPGAYCFALDYPDGEDRIDMAKRCGGREIVKRRHKIWTMGREKEW